jgi:peroxiredoxin
VQLQQNHAAFQSADTEVVALAVASLSSVGGAHQAAKADYPVLSDVDHQAASGFGVYNLLKDNLAVPSVFIIDTDGQIVWRYIGQNSQDRPGVQQILNNLP